MAEKNNKDTEHNHKDSLLEPIEPEEQMHAGTDTEADAEKAPIKLEPESANAKPGRFKRFWAGFWHKKKWTLPISVVVLLGLLLTIPATRYPMLALVIKKTYTVTVTDSTTHTPVSGAKVIAGNITATTNNKGKASVTVPVGSRPITITKQYYASYKKTLFVGLSGTHSKDISLVASGRQVPVTIINRITKKPVENAEITILDTTAKTDSNGKAVIVLPASAVKQHAMVMASSYNMATADITITSSVVTANTISITPSGKTYFLSNLSGTMDVVSTNLDGSDRKVVLAGTGKEDANLTSLSATPDWHYVALRSKRDGGEYAKLFLIDTTTGKLTTMDEGDASFSPIGWSGSRFVYLVTREKYTAWQPKRQALKSYNAQTGKITTLDETSADGSTQDLYAAQDIPDQDVHILGNTIFYAFVWQRGTYTGLLNNKNDQLLQIHSDGSSKKVLKEFARSSTLYYAYIDSYVDEPGEVYVSVEGVQGRSFYTYKDGSLSEDTGMTASSYYASRLTYIVSPSGQKTLWTEARDGKNTLLVGNADAKNGKEIATLTDYTAFGWVTDSYVLVTKNGSELYIMSANGGEAQKVADIFPGSQAY